VGPDQGVESLRLRLCPSAQALPARGHRSLGAHWRVGLGARHVFDALEEVRQRLPFPLLGIDSDNDSAFLNDQRLRYCQREQITFTRCRPYKKNDQAHVEQKNWCVIRRLVGYDRLEGEEAAAALNAAYEVLRLWNNFFQPSVKLIEKHREGAKVRKKYDEAKTPYQRVLASPDVAEAHKEALRQLYLTPKPHQPATGTGEAP